MCVASIYSVGHSNHSIDRFLGLLTSNGVGCIVDVRSAPYSRYSPHFSKPSLEAHLRERGIRYVYLGNELGGRPDDPACYDQTGAVDYERIARMPWFQEGVDALLAIANEQPTAIMCSEEDPSMCHRNLLITDTLLRQSRAAVTHIRGDGTTEPAEIQPKQTRLF
jgi:uncharacterized protein (DUF488 family)